MIMFFNSLHELVSYIDVDNYEFVDDVDNNKPEKEIDKKHEFEDEFKKTIFDYPIILSLKERTKFETHVEKVRSGKRKIDIPPPRL